AQDTRETNRGDRGQGAWGSGSGAARGEDHAGQGGLDARFAEERRKKQEPGRGGRESIRRSHGTGRPVPRTEPVPHRGHDRVGFRGPRAEEAARRHGDLAEEYGSHRGEPGEGVEGGS